MKRRFAPKRKLIRRKRIVRLMRRYGRRRIPQPIQYFKRTQYLSENTLSSNTADVFFNHFFTLSQVPDSTDFTNLYDQYCIKAVKITLIPRGNVADISVPGSYNGQSVGVFSVIDYDDTNLLTSIQKACEYPNMKMTRSHQQHSRYFKPRFNLNGVTNQGTGTVDTTMNTRGWLDCNRINVPHFGIKFALQQTPNVPQVYDVKIDYYLAFKNVR